MEEINDQELKIMDWEKVKVMPFKIRKRWSILNDKYIIIPRKDMWNYCMFGKGQATPKPTIWSDSKGNIIGGQYGIH